MPMMGPADEEDDLGDEDAVAAAMLAVGVEVTTAVAVMGTIEVRDCCKQVDKSGEKVRMLGLRCSLLEVEKKEER